MFGPGDEVVCVNDSEPPQSGDSAHHVVKGQNYTVTRMEQRPRRVGEMGPYTVVSFEWYVFLAEVPTPRNIGFYAFRFRKAEKKTRETDITVFQDIRREVERTVPAPVRKKEEV